MIFAFVARNLQTSQNCIYFITKFKTQNLIVFFIDCYHQLSFKLLSTLIRTIRVENKKAGYFSRVSRSDRVFVMCCVGLLTARHQAACSGQFRVRTWPILRSARPRKGTEHNSADQSSLGSTSIVKEEKEFNKEEILT